MNIKTEPIMTIPEILGKLNERQFKYNNVPYIFYRENKIKQCFPDESNDPEPVAFYTIEFENDNYKIVIKINKLKSSNLPDKLVFIFGFVSEGVDTEKSIVLSEL